MLGQTWSEARIVELTRLWSDGLSTTEIGQRLAVSKNAVIGKAHRLNLPRRGSPHPVAITRTEALARTCAASERDIGAEIPGIAAYTLKASAPARAPASAKAPLVCTGI